MGRFILAVLICVTLVSCDDDTREATLRYRLIATVEIDGQKVEGSTVMEIHYKNFHMDPHFLDTFIQFLTHINPRITAIDHAAEALILDLKGRGTVFILPTVHGSMGFSDFHGICLLYTLGIENKLHSLTKEDKGAQASSAPATGNEATGISKRPCYQKPGDGYIQK